MNAFKIDNNPKIKSGFTIPKEYFTEFPSVVLLLLDKKKEQKVFSFYKLRKKALISIAAILIFALSIPIFNSFDEQEILIDNNTLDSYIINNVRFTDEEIAEFLNEKDIQKLEIDLPIEDKTIEDFFTTNPNIEDYICK